MTRNLINVEVLAPFIARLVQRHPEKRQFIKQQLRSYVLKQESVFLLKDEHLGLSLWFKKLFGSATHSELQMLNRHGVWGSYLKLNLNEGCFLKYAHYLDFASDINLAKLKNMSFDDLIIKYRNRPAIKRIKIPTLSQGKDFRYLGKIGEYSLLELLTIPSFFEEGKRMRNCLGTHNVIPLPNKKMISVRNLRNKPIMTIHVDLLRKSIIDAKGVANSEPDSQVLNKICHELNLKHYPRRTSSLYDSLAMELVSQLVLVGLILLPSIVIFFLITWVIIK